VRAAVIDSSPLINLVHLELAQELVWHFDTIYVPRAVQVEVNRKHRFRYRLLKLYKTGLFVKCTSADKTNVALLQIDVGAGEAEALIQAKERNAIVFIGDEKRARELGFSLGLKPIGTVRILARLHTEDRAGDTGKLVSKLNRDLRFRVTEEVIRSAIAQAHEPI
jgi:predicted nucleic acid-binding protein